MDTAETAVFRSEFRAPGVHRTIRVSRVRDLTAGTAVVRFGPYAARSTRVSRVSNPTPETALVRST
ncbi:MAG: hypothetical protein Kow00109_23500 [Acidobacteriota bacterium]